MATDVDTDTAFPDTYTKIQKSNDGWIDYGVQP